MCARGLTNLKSPTTGEDFAIMRNGHPSWTGKVELIEEALTIPLRWRKPRRIFVNSMSDTFHKSVPDEWIDRVFAVMALVDHHAYIVCTKRAKRMRAYFSPARPAAVDEAMLWAIAQSNSCCGRPCFVQRDGVHGWPLPNVILLASVEDQPRADERISELMATPAAVIGISLEPMLGPVVLRPEWLKRLGWVIVGHESGPGARPCEEDWVRSVRNQCMAAGVAFFYKQKLEDGRKVEIPFLDGRQWVGYPEVSRG